MGDILGVLEDGQIVEGISSQGDQIGVVADLDAAALGLHAQIAQDVGRVGGRGLDGLQGRHAAVGDGVLELAAAVAQRHRVRRRRRDAQIRAQCDLEPGLYGQAVRGFVVFGRFEHFAVRLW